MSTTEHKFTGVPQKINVDTYIVTYSEVPYCVSRTNTPEVWKEFEEWRLLSKIAEIPYTESEQQLIKLAFGKRDSLFSQTEWRLGRFNSQIALGVPTTDSPEKYQEILVYLQALRDITEQSQYPSNILWPIQP